MSSTGCASHWTPRIHRSFDFGFVASPETALCSSRRHIRVSPRGRSRPPHLARGLVLDILRRPHARRATGGGLAALRPTPPPPLLLRRQRAFPHAPCGSLSPRLLGFGGLGSFSRCHDARCRGCHTGFLTPRASGLTLPASAASATEEALRLAVRELAAATLACEFDTIALDLASRPPLAPAPYLQRRRGPRAAAHVRLACRAQPLRLRCRITGPAQAPRSTDRQGHNRPRRGRSLGVARRLLRGHAHTRRARGQ